MLSFFRRFSALVMAAVLGGCAMIPPEPIVTGPLTAEPPAPYAMPVAEPNGSIYQPTAYGNYPLFEDRRPRNIGDIVTIVIQERTNAQKRVATSTERSSGAGLGWGAVPSILPGNVSPNQDFSISGSNAMDGEGSTRADNLFTGTLTTTVVGVLPNGNLQIAGDKQMAINRGSEHLRFSGVVDPRSITGSNTVASTLVSYARIDFGSKGTMDEVQTMGCLQRFFLNISPF